MPEHASAESTPALARRDSGTAPGEHGRLAVPATPMLGALQLQRMAGNAAVARLLTPPRPPRPSPAVRAVPAPTAAPVPVQRGLLDDVAGGVAGLAGGVRDSALQTLAGWARRMPGYELLCTVLGRDVVAGTPVPRSAVAIINGFLGLMPRGDELRQQLQQSGAIERAGAWFEEEVPKLGLTWETIRGLFSRAWDALSATDLLDPEGAWRRISAIFGPPLARLRDFAVGAVTKVAEFVFEGAMTMAGGAGAQVMGIIRQAGDVFNQIMRDPVAFARNLVAAIRGGLGQFLSNIGTHLRNGLIGWLTGSLGGVIRLPAQFDLRGILGMAMEFLGLTWPNIRTRIARVIGDRAMGLLERGAGIVADLAQNGISAITGRIAQFTSGLVDTVLGGIRDWVANSVVGAAITRLISMFNPAGAVIQAVIAVYNTIQFFIERAHQLGALANSIFTSIAAIASGAISNAVNAVEQALGRAVPVVLGFLARLIGLGDVATPVRNVMTRVQGVIDSAIDRVVGWIAGLARRIGGALRGGRTTPGTLNQPANDDVQLRAGQLVVDRLQGRHSESEIRSVVTSVRGELQPRGLRGLDLVPGRAPGAYEVVAQRMAKTVAKSKPPKAPDRTAHVTLEARFTFDQDAIKAFERGMGGPVRFFDDILPRARSNAFPNELTGRRRGMQLPGHDMPTGQFNASGNLLEPSTPGDTVAVVKAWNSGDPAKQSNNSHAESFLFPWIRHALNSRALKEVAVRINLSPCHLCARDFPDLSAHPGVAATLSYQAPYEGQEDVSGEGGVIKKVLSEGTTTQEDIALLTARRWAVSGTPPRYATLTNVRQEREAGIRIIRAHE